MGQLLTPHYIGAQLYTVREYLHSEIDLRQSLHKISDMGYQKVQMSAVGAMEGENPQLTPKDFRNYLNEFNLNCPGAHTSLERLNDHFDSEVEKLREVGCSFIAIGWVPPEFVDTEEGRAKFEADVMEISRRLEGTEINFAIHNHAHDTKFLDDLTLRLNIGFEVDVYWAAKAGCDPCELLLRHAGKVGLIHLKDIPASGEGFAAVGKGILNFAAITEAGLKAGVEHFVVEQDVCPGDPFDCLRESFNYLKYGD